jgi:hypothetical protein
MSTNTSHTRIGPDLDSAHQPESQSRFPPALALFSPEIDKLCVKATQYKTSAIYNLHMSNAISEYKIRKEDFGSRKVFGIYNLFGSKNEKTKSS